MSPEQRTKQRHKLQNSNKTLLKEKGRKSKRKHHKRKGGGLLPCSTTALTNIFKDQFICCKVENLGSPYRKVIRWLGDLINTPHHITWDVLYMCLC
jgi:hypothetical protein